MKKLLMGSLLGLWLFISSCANKKDILYYQDIQSKDQTEVGYTALQIQPNDILSVKIGSLSPEAAAPYNMEANFASQGQANTNIDIMKLQGYLVSEEGSIQLPIVGEVSVAGLSMVEAQQRIAQVLEDGNHLKDPTVLVRILNFKFSVLGEVNAPGTYEFTEQRLTLPQALGMAGDLTINGVRTDVVVIREQEGMRTVAHIDMTQTDWFDSPYYYIKQNDQIVVNQNNPRVKSAGFIGNVGSVISVVSIVLSTVVLITR